MAALVIRRKDMEERQSQSSPAPANDAFWVRLKSALVLVPVVLAAIYFGGVLFSALVSLACFVMIFEWTRMVEGRSLSLVFQVQTVGAAIALYMASTMHFYAAFFTVFICGVAALILSRRIAGGKSWSAFAAPYLIAPSVALIWLRNEAVPGFELTVLLFAVVWAGDVGAYGFGKIVGGPRVNPALSPAKTWAGIFGAVLAGGVVGLGVAYFYTGGSPIWAFSVGGSLGAASVLGDMVESAFKRIYGVKDISNLIPGHGGALDRLDGMIFATIAITLVLYVYNILGNIQGNGLG